METLEFERERRFKQVLQQAEMYKEMLLSTVDAFNKAKRQLSLCKEQRNLFLYGITTDQAAVFTEISRLDKELENSQHDEQHTAHEQGD